MKYLLPTLLLFSALLRLNAQGICDSVISIAPIQPICTGTGYTNLSVSHPGGVFSGPGLSNSSSSFLDAEYLSDGNYTATYTITGPGGCTVKATQPFVIRPAEEAFASVNGQIDCSNPNSTVFLNGFVFNSNNFWPGQWFGPPENNQTLIGNQITTKVAGDYRYIAYPKQANECPAYTKATVEFTNNPVTIKLVSCTNCDDFNGFPLISIKIDSVPPGWGGHISHNNASYFGAGGCVPIFPGETGIWKAQITNQQNGCISQASKNFTSTSDAHPHVSAGTHAAMTCGQSFNLLGAGPQSNSMINVFWTTPDGHFVGSNAGYYPKVDQPGTYILNAVNTFTGCVGTDTTVIGLFPPSLSNKIALICTGDNLNGHTQSGTYIDTIPLANGCFKVEITKLIVVPPIQEFAEIQPDDGQMSGSIKLFVNQGWPPFSFEWSTGETSDFLDNLSAGTYEVTVTDGNDCQYLRTIEVPFNRPGKSIATQRAGADLSFAKLYPNPGKSGQTQYTLELRSASALEADLMLHDVLGRNLFTRPVQIQEGKNVFTFSENLPAGTYTVFLKGDFGTKAVSKLVVAGGN